MFRAAGNRLLRDGKTRRRSYFSERELFISEIGRYARSDSPDRGNGKLSRGKEEPERFSIEEQTFSSSADTFFLPLKLHDPTHKSFMDYPLFMDTSDLFSTFYLH